MALPDDQLPEDVQYEDGPPPDAAAPDPLADVQAQHDALLADMGTADQPDPAALFNEHAAVLDELAPAEPDVAAPAPDLLNETAPAASIVQPQPQAYRPPAQRTPATRQQRREEHQQYLDQKARDIEDFHTGKLDPLPDDKGEGDKGNHPPEEQLRNVLEAGVKATEAMGDWLTELARRLEAVEQHIERERM